VPDLPATSTSWTLHDIGSFLGGIEFASLVVMLGALTLAGALWGFSARSGSILLGHRAQRVLVATVVGAAAVGGGTHLVSWAFHFGAFS
jgi:hypothetical protein